MKLYQIVNLKSGRKVRFSKKGYVWGCDCGNNGSFLLEHEVRNAERELGICYYSDCNGDCELLEYEASPSPPKKVKKRKSSDLDDDWL